MMATMHKVLCTTIPGNHQAVPFPFRPLPFLCPSAHAGRRSRKRCKVTLRGVGFKYAFPLESDTRST